jgi:hypothetical protein
MKTLTNVAAISRKVAGKTLELCGLYKELHAELQNAATEYEYSVLSSSLNLISANLRELHRQTDFLEVLDS